MKLRPPSPSLLLSLEADTLKVETLKYTSSGSNNTNNFVTMLLLLMTMMMMMMMMMLIDNML